MRRLISKLSVFMALLLVFGIFASGCGIIQKTPDAINKQNVAKVGNEYITRAELDVMFVYLKANLVSQYAIDENTDEGKKTLADQKRVLLSDLIDQKVLEQKAKELKLFKDDNEINDGIKTTIETNYKAGKSDVDYKKWMDDNKLTAEVINNIARFEVIGNKLYDYLLKDVTVTDEEIQNDYNANKSNYTEKPNTMEVSHILVNTEAEAISIKDKLDKGEDFATLAKQYSIDTEANKAGGSLGELQYNDPNYDQTFVISAMALKEGEISPPVQTSFGYHIIKVTKKTEYPVLPLETVKDDVKSQLLQQKQEAKYTDSLKEWRDKSGVETYDNNIDNTK